NFRGSGAVAGRKLSAIDPPASPGATKSPFDVGAKMIGESADPRDGAAPAKRIATAPISAAPITRRLRRVPTTGSCHARRPADGRHEQSRSSRSARCKLVSIGLGIAVGYLLARYGLDLDLVLSRTVATGIVVRCGLAVVIRLEGQGRRRRLAVAGLCAAM